MFFSLKGKSTFFILKQYKDWKANEMERRSAWRSSSPNRPELRKSFDMHSFKAKKKLRKDNDMNAKKLSLDILKMSSFKDLQIFFHYVDTDNAKNDNLNLSTIEKAQYSHEPIQTSDYNEKYHYRLFDYFITVGLTSESKLEPEYGSFYYFFLFFKEWAQ